MNDGLLNLMEKIKKVNENKTKILKMVDQLNQHKSGSLNYDGPNGRVDLSFDNYNYKDDNFVELLRENLNNLVADIDKSLLRLNRDLKNNL